MLLFFIIVSLHVATLQSEVTGSIQTSIASIPVLVLDILFQNVALNKLVLLNVETKSLNCHVHFIFHLKHI